MRQDDVLLSVTTISFDIAGLELLLPLTLGAKVELLPARAARDGSQIAAALRASGATLLQATPTSWRLLLEQDWSCFRLERALCGGEALPRALAERLLARGLELWNLYGPTETTIWSTRQRIEMADASVAAEGSCRIGSPIAQTSLYVLDRELEPVPAGVAGELFIGGAGVARGYVGRPGLTAERFLPDPFGTRRGARMYRTGDRVRHADGQGLEFLGRIDDQIKLRGHRIELGEIEAVLALHAGVSNAAVVLRGEADDAELVAYLVAREGLVLPDGELAAWLGQRLPAYMAVSRYVWLASLPLTLNGKLDRARLPHAPQAARAERHTPARSTTELRLARIWSDVLGSDNFGVEDDFFQRGGHSLRATRVVAQIRAIFQVSLPLVYFFDHPTIGELALEIEQQLLRARAAPEDPAGEGEEELTL
jgi:acyl-coenzyme A synthetase/AMP-(fatty) acid ligase